MRELAPAVDGPGSAVGARTVALHALTWLFLGNAVGLLLATLLLAPRFGSMLGPLTYGRWMPVHLDAQLYGWSGLPLVGLLLAPYLPRSTAGDRLARLAVGVWSGSLAFAAVTWLAGESSGKLFLEWSGPARFLLVGNLAFLAAVLAIGWMLRAAEGQEKGWTAAVKGGVLLCLLPVPAVFWLATDPAVYPSINPDSGGATGGSLLGSVLAVVAIFWATPLVVGVSRRGPLRPVVETGALLALHFLWFALLDHGDHSHHEALQVASLASLSIWPPLLVRHLRGFRWPAASRRWLAALAGWGTLLTVDGVVTYLPGVLERWKFTDAMVGHAHLAMAGMASSFSVIALLALAPDGALHRSLASRGPFLLWNVGTAAYVMAMVALGTLEGWDPGLLFHSHPAVAVAYAARWLAGLAMLAASGRWLVDALASSRPERLPDRVELREERHAA